MATLIKGLLAFNLDWQFVMVGVALAVTVELCGVGVALVRGRRLPAAVDHVADLRRRPGPRAASTARARKRGETRRPHERSSAPATCSPPASSRAAPWPAWPIAFVTVTDSGRARDRPRCRSRTALTRALGAGGYQILGLGCFVIMAVTLLRVALKKPSAAER